MEEKILYILLDMQQDVKTIKEDQLVMKDTLANVQKEQASMKETLTNVQKEQSSMKRTLKNVQKEQKEIRKEQQEFKEGQAIFRKDLRIININVAKILETLTENLQDNKKEHEIFNKRITSLEMKTAM